MVALSSMANSPKNFIMNILNAVLEDKSFQKRIGSENRLSELVAYLFTQGKWYYHNYVSYDFYSILEIGQTKPLPFWKKLSLDSLNQYAHTQSPSGLAFVDSIMVITGKHLKIRHDHIELVFLHQGIPRTAIEYRWKWNKQNCADPRNFRYIKSIFPYKSGNHTIDPGCSTIMEHIDAWYSIADRNLSFALILEDDVTFVSFLTEKFNRFVSEAVKLELIKVGRRRNACSHFPDHANVSVD